MNSKTFKVFDHHGIISLFYSSLQVFQLFKHTLCYLEVLLLGSVTDANSTCDFPFTNIGYPLTTSMVLGSLVWIAIGNAPSTTAQFLPGKSPIRLFPMIRIFYLRIDKISTATIMQRIPKKSGSVNGSCIISTVAAVAVTGSTDAKRLALDAPIIRTPSI